MDREYRERHPEGYGYTQFCEHYRNWAKTQSPTGRFPHNGGEVMEVDYAGLTVTIFNPECGAARQAPVIVAAFPVSDYVYAEVQPSQGLCHWINGHVRAFQFFGILPKILRPDNPNTGMRSPNFYELDLNPTYQEMPGRIPWQMESMMPCECRLITWSLARYVMAWPP